MKFFDEAVIFVSSGAGGGGSVHFRREKFVPNGGPDGGDGGKGGSVIIQASESKYSLLDYRYQRAYRAQNGSSGGGSNQTGKDGEDIILTVPQGTLIYEYDSESKQKKHLLADLKLADCKVSGHELCVVKGGRGGKGNWFFRSATHQAPKFSQPGEPGEEKYLFLEIQLLADVGLVGFPNAGKSSLLRVISNARPKVADYPFTTLEPHLGLVRQFDKDMVISDLPGLIEGASQGAGLGLKFLKHVQRNKCLLFMLNLDPHEKLEPAKQYSALRQELTDYNPQILEKRCVIALNKTDLISPKETLKTLKSITDLGLDPRQVFPISALTREGIEKLLKALYNAVYET